ncbi:MAG TPA: hypothetical protein VGC32_12815 [Solirubrobacterales bacterium]
MTAKPFDPIDLGPIALAAGHRPCGECRHAEYVAYKAAWGEARGGPPPSAREMNRRLHE